MKTEIPQFATKEETFAFLRRNKDIFKAMKKAEKKLADGVGGAFYFNDTIENESKIIKANDFTGDKEKATKIKIVPVINTTNLLDSHMDVHMPKLWNRSIKNISRPRILNQEHKGYEFTKVIADNIIPKVELISWSDLGYDWAGKTEALIYPTDVEKIRNEYMFKQYINGWVKNHSVEMYYIQLHLAMFSDNKADKAERDNWEEYRPNIINGDVADEFKWFWAVTEAKEVGGAAVPQGSNYVTPTQMVEDVSSNKHTLHNEPPNDTHETKTGWELFNFNKSN